MIYFFLQKNFRLISDLLIITLLISGCAIRSSSNIKDEIHEGKKVEATGIAPIIDGDRPKAKRAALLDAQRNAVEKALGVLVSGKTLVDKAVAVQNKISVRTEGQVRKFDILSEQETDGFYEINLRAWVLMKSSADSWDGDLAEEATAILEKAEKSKTENRWVETFDLFFEALQKAQKGKDEELVKRIASDLETLFSSLQGELKTPDIYFNHHGEILSQPILKIYFINNKKKVPLTDFPLKTEFNLGRGRVNGSLKTSPDGTVNFGSVQIDTYKDKARLKITPGWDLVSSSMTIPSWTSWEIVFHKRKRIALSVVLQNGNHIARDVTLARKIISTIENNPFETECIDWPLGQISRDEDLRGQVDFFAEVSIKMDISKHPQLNIYKSSGRGILQINRKQNNESISKDEFMSPAFTATSQEEAITKTMAFLERKIALFLQNKLKDLSLLP